MFPEVKSCEFQKTWNENSKWFDVGDRQGRLWKYDPMTALVFIWELLSDIYKNSQTINLLVAAAEYTDIIKGNPPTEKKHGSTKYKLTVQTI